MESVAISARQTLSRDLSKAPSMVLGPLTVDPPRRTLSSYAGTRVLEPRVMRTLIVLAEAQGEVLSRDDLIELAWDGVIVGDNAINRVISHLRKALSALAGETVQLETITKVGFRLEVDGEAPLPTPLAPEAPGTSRLNRRALLGIGVAAAAGALGYAGWRVYSSYRPDPRAKALLERGQLTQKTGEPGTMETAIGFYKQAVEIDPDYADAWGALAIAYRHSIQGFSSRKAEAFEELAHSAAARALQLDPDQPDADAVDIMFKPKYGRLAAAERDLRALVDRHPDYWYGLGQLGIALREGGRIRESLPITAHQVECDEMLPVGWGNLARARTYAGDLQGADQAIGEGLKRFPTNLAIWGNHYRMLIESGRFTDAAAVARDGRERPEYIPPQTVELLGGMADALAAGPAADLPAWRDRLGAILEEEIFEASWLGPAMFQFGLVDEAFAALSTYFDMSGRPALSLYETSTAFLFSPPVLRHRNDPRFAALLEATGLEAYWKETGSQPDFRRT